MTFEDLGIKTKPYKQYKTKCPNCARLGKKNLNDDLSVNAEKGLFNCHKCEWSGSINEKRAKIVIDTQNMTKITDDGLRFFTGRGISQEVVNANRIGMNGNMIQFPYFFEGAFVNFKARSIEGKDFRQAVGGMQVMFNYDRLKGTKELYVVEGEIDAMSLEMVGIVATSVSQGAPNESDKNVDKKLECVSNSWDLFEEAETVVIAVDNDANGKRLRDELIRRIGAVKCKVVDWGDYKDANEVLCKEGKDGLLKCLESAKDCKIEGIFQIEDIIDDMAHYFREGEDMGHTTHYPDLDECFKWKHGEVTLWTGYMNEGKSLFLKTLALLKAVKDKWKIAIFTPEEYPARFFFNDLIHTYLGRPLDKKYKNCVSDVEYLEAANELSQYFYYIYPPKKFSIDTINESFQWLIKKKGVQMVIADPFNKFYHNRGNSMRDEYIGIFMTKLEQFAKEYQVCYNLVAHQNTPEVQGSADYDKPDAYKIKGGGTFADMADNIVTVWRPHRRTDYKNKKVVVESQKIKKQKLVGVPGETEFEFDFMSNRYLINGVSPFDRYSMPSNDTFLELNDDMPF